MVKRKKNWIEHFFWVIFWVVVLLSVYLLIMYGG